MHEQRTRRNSWPMMDYKKFGTTTPHGVQNNFWTRSTLDQRINADYLVLAAVRQDEARSRRMSDLEEGCKWRHCGSRYRLCVASIHDGQRQERDKLHATAWHLCDKSPRQQRSQRRCGTIASLGIKRCMSSSFELPPYFGSGVRLPLPMPVRSSSGCGPSCVTA